MMTAKITLALLPLLISYSIAQTLWVYDPTTWRSVADARLNLGAIGSEKGISLEACQTLCADLSLDPTTISNSPNEWVECASITWDPTNSDQTQGDCSLYKSKFGFTSNGFVLSSGVIGGGDLALLQYKSGTTYYEKPVDYGLDLLIDAGNGDDSWILTETLNHHLISNALRLNKKGYNQYKEQTNTDPLNYDQFLMYYRAGQPGYVNNSDAQSTNKYSVIVEYEEVADEEECAKYCTRNRGAIDAELGTRCVSFNYHERDQLCHLLSFAMDGVQYIMDADVLPDRKPLESSNNPTGWKYYEGLVGQGCWVVHGQCRKWNDPTYQAQQLKVGRTGVEVGYDIGVMRVDASDPDCETLYGNQCTNPDKQWEYICLTNAKIYHEDRCDNDADKGTVAYWSEDGAGVAEIWNSWDLTEGCVIDLTTNPFNSSDSYKCIKNINGSENERFSEKIFRDSIGEEEFSAGIDKKRCWERAQIWYNYCGIEDQGTETYLNVSWPSDGSYYLAPAIPCSCDAYGEKIETTFGMQRRFCTRSSDQQFCYREAQEDYWDELDILCDDVVPAPDFDKFDVQPCAVTSYTGQVTGCYLYYPKSGSESKQNIEFKCRDGGSYDFEGDEHWNETNDVLLRPLRCEDVSAADDPCEPEIDFSFDKCLEYAQIIHNSCGNLLQDPYDQIRVWYRPTGEIGTFPQFANPYEATVIRGVKTAATYTEDPDLTLVDMVPIRNGRWQTFSPVETGSLRQLNVYYRNTDEANLTLTIWFGVGITESIFLGQVSVIVPSTNNTATYVHFPLSAITLTAGETYTWQVTSIADNSFGELGYVRGNGYSNGVGDLAWDYLFVAWIEGIDEENQAMVAIAIPETAKRPWFEIWCVMIIILFIIFLVFLCLLHWKRRYDEEQERKEDKKFQAELRQRAMLQAEAERNAKNGIEEDYDEDYDEEYDEDDRHGQGQDREEEYDDDQYVEEEDEYGDAGGGKTRKASNHLSPGGKDYKRVKSASRNAMPESSDDGGDGYQDTDAPKKKKKRKKKKPKKKHSFADEDEDDYQDFAD